MDSSNIGKAGFQRNKNVGPNPPSTPVNNFESFNPGAAKQARGHKPVNPQNVRGHANYK